MANASTIRRQISGTQQLTIAPLSGTTITTTATAFQLNNNALTGVGGGVIPLTAGQTGLYAGTGQVIWIHAAGTLIGGTASTTTLILKLYEVPASVIASGLTATSFTNWNLLATSATGTLASGVTSGNFAMDAEVQLDSNGNLSGDYTSQVFASSTGSQAAITQATGLVGEADLNFVMVATLGGAETGVTVTLDEFSLNLL